MPITRIEIYHGSQDPVTKSWPYRVKFADGTDREGMWPGRTAAIALIGAAKRYGTRIKPGDVSEDWLHVFWSE